MNRRLTLPNCRHSATSIPTEKLGIIITPDISSTTGWVPGLTISAWMAAFSASAVASSMCSHRALARTISPSNATFTLPDSTMFNLAFLPIYRKFVVLTPCMAMAKDSGRVAQRMASRPLIRSS